MAANAPTAPGTTPAEAPKPDRFRYRPDDLGPSVQLTPPPPKTWRSRLAHLAGHVLGLLCDFAKTGQPTPITNEARTQGANPANATQYRTVLVVSLGKPAKSPRTVPAFPAPSG